MVRTLQRQKTLRKDGKNTQKNRAQSLNDLDSQDGVISHLEPDVLECEVKRALGSITTSNASGGDGIPAELFQILKKVLLLKCCTHYASTFRNSKVATGLENSVFIPIPKKTSTKKMFKLLDNCTHSTCYQG